MDKQFRSINSLLMLIERRRRQIGENTMRALDILPSQHFVLAALRRMGRAASQAQIAEIMQVSPASVARTMKSLDRDGYIRRSSGEDERCNEIAVNQKGEDVLRHSCALFSDLDARSYAGFSADELEQMQGMLERMLNNLSQIKDDMEKEMGK